MSYDDRGSAPRSGQVSLSKKIAATLAAAGAVLVPLGTWFTTEKTPADKIALSYGGGPFEGNQYQDTVQPGSGLKFNGWFDKWYEYPVTVRNYIVSNARDEGDKESFDVIETTDKDGVIEQVELTVSFRLNEELVQKFHERLGMKYKAWDDDGWKKMLGDNVRQPLNNAVVKALKEFSTDDIKKNSSVYVSLEEAIEAELPGALKSIMGDNYFCGPSGADQGACSPIKVVVKSITPKNQSVNDSYDKQKETANGIVTAQNEAQQQIERATGEKASKDAVAEALTPEYLAYLDVQAKLECAKRPNCVMVTTDAGGQLPQLTIPVPTLAPAAPTR